jgi:hypothetical protein
MSSLRALRGLRRAPRYSSLGEDAVATRLFEALGITGGCAVDIGAYDGESKSNTLALYELGWTGLAVEGDPHVFAKLARAYRRFVAVDLARMWVTPETVVPLLQAHRVGREFEFLSLDIDGYDHFVLETLLGTFRPLVICAEINEKIPPPVKFTVIYRPDYVWAEDHFYGQSLSKLHELASGAGYALVELHYNSAFLVPKERSPLPALDPERAYREGYLDRPDRLSHFPWNRDMERLHKLDTDEKIAFIRARFAKYEGYYEIGC